MWIWVDDLTTLEVINLITVGLSSYNFKNLVASDIPTHGQFVEPKNLKSQQYINTLNTWADKHKIMLSE